MNTDELWDFMDQQQKKALLEEEDKIKKRFTFPLIRTQLETAVLTSQVTSILKEVDPTAETLRQRLMMHNRDTIIHFFRQLTEQIFLMILKTIDRFEAQRTISYLKIQFCAFLTKKFKTKNFQWKGRPIKRGSLWMCLHEEVRLLLQDILQFLIKHFQLRQFPFVREMEQAMGRFCQHLKNQRKKLDKIYPLDQQEEEGQQQRQENKILERQARFDQLLDAVEQMEKKEEEEEKQKKDKEDILPEKQKGSSYLSTMVNSGYSLMGNLSGMVTKYTSRYSADRSIDNKQQMPIDKNQQKLNKIRNEVIFPELADEEMKLVDKLSTCSQQQLSTMIGGKFTADEKKILKYAIRQPLIRWEAQDTLITGASRLVQNNKIFLLKWEKSLIGLVDSFHEGTDPTKDKLLIFTGLIYKQLQEDYLPLKKHYLSRICQTVERTLPKCPYLRGALKLYEATSINPSSEAVRLECEMPYRSASFPESDRSKYFRQNDYNRQTPNPEFSFLQENEHIRFQKLNYSKPTKSVVFLINGYLSEDKNQDLEWTEAIHSLYQSQLYGVVWRSSTKMELIKNLALTTGSYAAMIPGIRLPPVVRLAQYGMSWYNRFTGEKPQQKGMFEDSRTRAGHAGKELADKIMNNFSDRHVTLIGFSMGAEVVKACIERLAQRTKLHLLLKVVTLGGAVDQCEVQKVLRKCYQPVSWLNFQSSNDYVLKYMYRVCTMGGKPIGLSGVNPAVGHQIQNWEVSQLVNGHLDFLRKMQELVARSGLHDL